MNNLDKYVNLTSSKCIRAISLNGEKRYLGVSSELAADYHPDYEEAYKKFTTWEERDSWLLYEAWDNTVIKTIRSMHKRDVLEDHPLLELNIEKNLMRYDIWSKFKKEYLTVPSTSSLKQLITDLDNVDLYTIENFIWPSKCIELDWIVQNVLINQLSKFNATIDELSSISLGFGRTLIQLVQLIEAKYIRRNQAKSIIELAIAPIYMTIPLRELLLLDEFSSIIDEEAIDDSINVLINRILTEENKAVEQFLSGKEKALGSIMGKILKQVKINPQTAKEMVIAQINLL